jgi:nicotinamide phosphoribosyltransferase
MHPINALLLTDGYKTGHHKQYPDKTELVYSNWTPRANKYAPNKADHVVVFGPQMVMAQIHEAFKTGFFGRPKAEVCEEMKRELSLYLGSDYDVSHFEALHDLGYLPIRVKAITEGELVPIRIPILTIQNTLPEFFWITNYLETILSNLLWKPMTSATIAFQYRQILEEWQQKTDAGASAFVEWQGHDFSMRGMDSIEVVIASGLGHATSFKGSDSLPVIYGGRRFYEARGAVIGSVNATEHSVMCAGKKDAEIETFRRLLRIYAKGILSVVSDTWDLWRVLTQHVVELKEEILARDGKLVIRPDSGNPADIICGYNSLDEYELKEKQISVEASHPSYKGVVELLWETFGGTINAQGFKVLDPRVGAIYGDSITIERAKEICRRLASKGFASTNVVLGIGSFTYQFNTRDTFGFAMKATYVEVGGEAREIFKDPVTDGGIKKSACGLLRVDKVDGEFVLRDRVSRFEEGGGELKEIYTDGIPMNRTTLDEIRARVSEALAKARTQKVTKALNGLLK